MATVAQFIEAVSVIAEYVTKVAATGEHGLENFPLGDNSVLTALTWTRTDSPSVTNVAISNCTINTQGLA